MVDAVVVHEGEEEEVAEQPRLSSDVVEDIARLRSEGYEVDDDNDPVPENLPTATAPGEATFLEWNQTNVCHRKAEGHRFEASKLVKPLGGDRCIDYFLYFLPVTFLKDVVIKATNMKMNEGEGGEVTWGEFIRYVGLWFVNVDGCLWT